jgi:hypothetical protein
MTNTNRTHVQSVWGNQGVTNIQIPLVIDDYNHYMGGVDKADQLIAYYRPDLRCRRVWMPLMFHTLDCMKTNSYTCCKHSGYKELHKVFTMEWCKALFARAKAEEVRHLRQQRHTTFETTMHGSVIPVGTKRRRMSHTNPELPEYCFSEPKKDHHLVCLPIDKKPKTCTYCSFICAMENASGLMPDPP